MDEAPKVFAPELSPSGSRRWIGRLVIAVLLGAGIWNFVVALTVNVVVPGLARVMEADPQSPMYLGKGEINVAALFVSLLQLCFALIAALAVSAVSDRGPKPARRKTVSAAPSLAPATVPVLVPAAPIVSTPPAQRVEQPREPSPAPIPAPLAPPVAAPAPPAAPPPEIAQASPKPAKPPKPKKVYYNSVGERIEEDE